MADFFSTSEPKGLSITGKVVLKTNPMGPSIDAYAVTPSSLSYETDQGFKSKKDYYFIPNGQSVQDVVEQQSGGKRKTRRSRRRKCKSKTRKNRSSRRKKSRFYRS